MTPCRPGQLPLALPYVMPAFKTDIPKDIRADMGAFLDAMGSEPVDLKNLEIKDQGLNSILDELRRIYVND